jgi:spore coat protein U-like protein
LKTKLTKNFLKQRMMFVEVMRVLTDMAKIPLKLGLILEAGILATVLQTSADAQTVTGTVDATITLSAACEVNGSTATSGVNFGTLDFGSVSTFFSSADAQVDGNGSGSISVQCSPGSGATLTINSGLHDAAVSGGSRALTDGSQYIPYDIYSDAGFNTVLNNNSTLSITADGTVQTVPIYGRAVGASGLSPGTYTDTISVTLTF